MGQHTLTNQNNSQQLNIEKFMTTQELNLFWSARDIKIWVVTLTGTGGNIKTDKKIVRAKTEERALICAKNNSMTFHNKRCHGTARYAHPINDLHCTTA